MAHISSLPDWMADVGLDGLEITGDIPILRDAARCLKYSRARAYEYDDIAFVFGSAHCQGGPVPFATVPSAKLAHAIALDHDGNSAGPDQRRLLAHRALDLPDGHFRYEFLAGDNLLRVYLPDDPAGADWIYSLSAPPESLAKDSEARDASRNLSSSISADLPKVAWIRLPEILAGAGFVRGGPALFDKSSRVLNDGFYVFVSHRWRNPHHPDPDGMQARLLCCQLFATLIEAIGVANLRGLKEPRRFSTLLGRPIGPQGSELAERMIVNLLRPNTEASQLDQLATECADLAEFALLGGTAAAKSDAALSEIAHLLSTRPALKGLIERIHVWYDYSCIPQEALEQPDVIDSALESLAGLQLLGCTVVMLDDPFDYLSRAWCTLEIGNADAFGSNYHLLTGSHRATASRGLNEHHFEMLMEDRVHLIWRGLLDTVVFRSQDAAECMRRLGLAVTKPTDLVKLFDRLSLLPAPSKIHVDRSELLTGTMPYPALFGVTSLSKAWGKSMDMHHWIADSQAYDLDLTEAMTIRSWGNALRSSWRDYPSFESSDRPPVERGCHLAIVGSCEGEAILWAAEFSRRRTEIEATTGMLVTSVSWLATDIAPVGTLADACLSFAPVSADLWIVASLSTRFEQCDITNRIVRAALAAGHEIYLLMIDRQRENLRRIPSQVAKPRKGQPRELPAFAGGVFSAELRSVVESVAS